MLYTFRKTIYGKVYVMPLTLALYSWECALKITGIELKLLTDVYIINDYKNCISGGITRAFTIMLKYIINQV